MTDCWLITANPGEQVWLGALLLAEFLMQRHATLFTAGNNEAALELGAGTGLCSLILHRLGVGRVFCTGKSAVYPYEEGS
jgi:hypothetical protein